MILNILPVNYPYERSQLIFVSCRKVVSIYRIISITVTSSWYCSVIGQVSSDPGEVYWIGLHDLNGEGIYQWLDEADEVRGNPLRICIRIYHTFENIVVDFFVFDPFFIDNIE